MAETVQDLNLHQFKINLKKRLDKKLEVGDTWYPLDPNWLNKCKKYVGLNSEVAGDSKFNPGPIDTTSLLREDNSGDLRDGLIEGIDYTFVPQEAWEMLVSRFTIVQNCRHQTSGRKVVKYGFCEANIELHLIKLELVDYRNPEVIVEKSFSNSDTIASVKEKMLIQFNLDKKIETRIYTARTLLDKLENIIYFQAGIGAGSKVIIQQINEDGTWPPKNYTKKSQNKSLASDGEMKQTKTSDQVNSCQDQDTVAVEEIKYVSANDVNVDLLRTKQEVVRKLKIKIDNLIDKQKERGQLNVSEKEELEKRHQERLKAITLKKENEIAKILIKERAEMEEEHAMFTTEKENLEINQNGIKAAIGDAIDELSKKIDKLNGVEEEHADLKKAMECPVCLDQMKPPTQIFQCTSGHLLCGECKWRIRGGKCPTCKKAQLMGRAIAMEQMARTLYGEQN